MPSSHPLPTSCHWFSRLAAALDARSAPRLAWLLVGAVLARDRRTVTSWLRAAGLSVEYPANGKWPAVIGCNGVQRHLGFFVTADDAARTYDAARELFGEDAWLSQESRAAFAAVLLELDAAPHQARGADRPACGDSRRPLLCLTGSAGPPRAGEESMTQ
jgi:hypothetical protein